MLSVVTKPCCGGGGAGVYVALFHWLVTKLNRTTGAPHVAGGPAPRTVSILDIYGFEVRSLTDASRSHLLRVVRAL